MSLKEDVQILFNRQHAITSEILRRYDKGLAVDDLRTEESEIQAELKAILTQGLKGDYEIKDMEIEKDCAKVTITNGIFVIPCSVKYKKVGLSDFARKPGAKQIAKRVEELKFCLEPQQLLGLNKCVVGTSYFEAQEGRGWIIISQCIGIVA